MRRYLTSLALVTTLFTSHTLLPLRGLSNAAIAQFQPQSDLYYTFYNQRIPLTQRADQVAVVFASSEEPTGTRNWQSSGEAGVVQLQRDLLGIQGDRPTRGDLTPSPDPLEVSVEPLGNQYAVIQLPNDANQALREAVEARLQQPYIESTLPVLSRADSEDTIVLPNEILLSFEPGTAKSQITLTLSRYGLEMVRPLQFSDHRYLVRSPNHSGLEVLAIANQLNGAAAVQAAAPNFVQTVAYSGSRLDALTRPVASGNLLEQLISALPTVENLAYPSALWPLLWHLDSTPLRGRLQPRTDIRATEAWEISNQGEDVVVAVIDSLIQWDHPDLQDNVVAIAPDAPNRLPGEVHGWDFSNREVVCASQSPSSCIMGDPDTRISSDELEVLKPHFQNSFTLSDQEFSQTYAGLIQQIQSYATYLSDWEALQMARNYIQNKIAAEFHGTWSAGVVAANPAETMGAVGVAPQAEILPIRVFGLGGEITSAALIEAVGYAAARDADIINMSLGGLLPDRALTDQLFAIQDAHPDLVIVASAGNNSLDGVAFPAATPGVLSVGATTVDGVRSPYSTYGAGLDIVAPGGDTHLTSNHGILTTGGTGNAAFWSGLEAPERRWGVALDPQGAYVQVQGTSFSAPAIAGVLALMKGEDAQNRLSREQLMDLLKETASYEGLQLSQADANQYRLQASVGFGTAGDFPFLRPTGVFPVADPVSAEAYFFGWGLVNARAAVEAVQDVR